MRIIGGIAAGRLLKVPKGLEVRPTPDLVRQAIFNSLGRRVIEAHVLELFAGSGALGFECLSRGAADLLAVEKSNRAARLINENLRASGLDEHRFQLRIHDAFAAVAQLAAASRRFDLILADPPYGEKNINRRSTSFAQRLLDDDHLPGLLVPGGLFILGHTKRDTLTFPPLWSEKKLLKHGDSLFRFLETEGFGGS